MERLQLRAECGRNCSELPKIIMVSNIEQSTVGNTLVTKTLILSVNISVNTYHVYNLRE